MTFKYILSTFILVVFCNIISFAQDISENTSPKTLLALPQVGTILMSDDSLYQGSNSRIFYGLGFKTQIDNAASAYFVFDLKMLPETSLRNDYPIFALSIGVNSQQPLTDKLYSQLGFMIGLTNFTIPATGASNSFNKASFAWEGNIGLVHQMSPKTLLEFNVGYLKSHSSIVSGFIIQTGIVQRLHLNKKKELSLNKLIGK